jgi:mono/diheme cytochrome c family protein
MRWSWQFGYPAWLTAILLFAAGCGTSHDFRPNRVYLKMQQDVTRVNLSPTQREDIADILAFWFGTADDPQIPQLDDVRMDQMLNLDRLHVAAGPVGSEEDGTNFGVYRKHCAICHGISGDGVGPAGSLLNPYARDFRRGIFKYKSTAGPMTPPTDEDLRSLLVRGMPGTSMPSFHLLADAELDALVEYVKYLSIRGAVERALIVESVDQLNGPDDRLAAVSFDEDPPERIRETLSDLTPLVSYVAREWRDAPSRVATVPPRPSDWNSAEAIRRGRDLYLGEVANCAKCHGPEGRGDGETVDYDDWTKEYFDPQSPAAVRGYLALGALKPRQIEARDLRWGVFHGGGRPEDIYQRIYHGIPGTPMPAAPMRAEDARPGDIRLTPRDLWDLVAFVLSLSGSEGDAGNTEIAQHVSPPIEDFRAERRHMN